VLRRGRAVPPPTEARKKDSPPCEQFARPVLFSCSWSCFGFSGSLARAHRAGRTTGSGTWPFLSFRSDDHVAAPLLESRKRLRRMSFASSRDTEEQPHLGPFGKLLFL